MTEKTAQPDASQGRARWLVASVAFACFLCMLNTHTINIALPVIAQHFQVDTGMVARVTLAYLMTMTCLLLVFGKLDDQLGLKRLFISGYGLFTAGSLLSGIAPSLGILILGRAVQGIGASMLLTTGTAIIARHVPPNRRGWGFGIQGAFSAAGAMLGAPLGGLITQYAGWHWVFLANVPVCILAAVLAKWAIPVEKPSAPARQVMATFDWPGAGLSFAGIFLLLSGLNMGRKLGWASPAILTCFATGVLLLLLFMVRERKCAAPLLNLAMFRDRAFTCANLAGMAAFMVMTGSNFLMPFYLARYKHQSAAATGFVVMLFSAVFLLASPIAGRLSDRIHPARLCAAGMACAIAACIILQLTLQMPGLMPALVFLGLFGFSFAMFASPNNNQVMGLAPPAMAGTAASVFRTAGTFGSASGLALFEALFSMAPPRAAVAADPAAMLASGFRAAYGFGALLCLAALVLSLAAGRLANWQTIQAHRKEIKP